MEQWYEGLEGLSSSRQVLSEPFYRLYEIKVGHGNKRGGGGRRRRRVRNEEREIVKIFENESSFVADGTTGLVTWKVGALCFSDIIRSSWFSKLLFAVNFCSCLLFFLIMLCY